MQLVFKWNLTCQLGCPGLSPFEGPLRAFGGWKPTWIGRWVSRGSLGSCSVHAGGFVRYVPRRQKHRRIQEFRLQQRRILDRFEKLGGSVQQSAAFSLQPTIGQGFSAGLFCLGKISRSLEVKRAGPWILTLGIAHFRFVNCIQHAFATVARFHAWLLRRNLPQYPKPEDKNKGAPCLQKDPNNIQCCPLTLPVSTGLRFSRGLRGFIEYRSRQNKRFVKTDVFTRCFAASSMTLHGF